MKESIINHTIRKSLTWGFKIPDGARIKLCFDGFGTYKGRALYWEAKYLNKPMAFNFKRLEDHQIANLLAIEEDNSLGNFIPLFLIAVSFSRGDLRVYYYKDMKEIAERKYMKKSITKKEFESSSNYVTIKKSLINIEEIINEKEINK